MIARTHAIVLRYYPVANTSRVVSWFTRDAGRISTLIKGALRPRSPFLGQYDLFYTCELLYYTRNTRNLHIARECAPLKWRPEFRQNWKASACASYFADLYFRLSPPGAHHAGLFDLLDQAMDALHNGDGAESMLYWFELRLLDHLGLSPRLQQCLNCRRSFESVRSGAHFAHRRGGILCASCARKDPEAAPPIPPDVLSILLNWQSSETPQACRSTRCTPAQLAVMEKLLLPFLEHHLNLSPKSRPLALKVLRR